MVARKRSPASKSRQSLSKRQKTRATSPQRSPVGFLALPREIRDVIYGECLVSTEVIDLSNLRMGSHNHPRFRHQALGLLPNILRTCRQIEEEASQVLYGSNMFSVELQPMWEYTKHRKIRELLDDQMCARCPYACLACCDKIHSTHNMRYSRSRGTPCPIFRPTAYARLVQITPAWSRRVHQVRRLHVALRPYSYNQWFNIDTIRYWLLGIGCKEDRGMVHGCNHSQQHALPKLRNLDLLILHVSKLSLVLAEEDMDLVPIGLYPVDAKAWRASAREAMTRETSWLLSFAKQAAKVIVVPDSGDAQGLTPEQRDYLDLTCGRPKRGALPLNQTIFTKIPPQFLRTGSLATIASSQPPVAPVEELLPYWTRFPGSAQEDIARVRRNCEVPVLHGSQHLIYDSL